MLRSQTCSLTYVDKMLSNFHLKLPTPPSCAHENTEIWKLVFDGIYSLQIRNGRFGIKITDHRSRSNIPKSPSNPGPL